MVDLRSTPKDRTVGLFLHFQVTSRDEHLASIKAADTLREDDASWRAENDALYEQDRKARLTFDARICKRGQRAHDKVKVSKFA